MSHLNLLGAIPLSLYGLLGVTSKMLDIFSHPSEGRYLVGETEVASEVWVRQMTKRAEPIVETGATLLSIALGNLRNFLLLLNLPFALVGGVLSHFGS